jgi:ABC-type transporter Mla subunit MlaD
MLTQLFAEIGAFIKSLAGVPATLQEILNKVNTNSADLQALIDTENNTIKGLADLKTSQDADTSATATLIADVTALATAVKTAQTPEDLTQAKELAAQIEGSVGAAKTAADTVDQSLATLDQNVNAVLNKPGAPGSSDSATS